MEIAKASSWQVAEFIGGEDIFTRQMRDRKLISLLKKNKLKSNGKFGTKFRALLSHYENHPETLPTLMELLCVYPPSI